MPVYAGCFGLSAGNVAMIEKEGSPPLSSELVLVYYSFESYNQAVDGIPELNPCCGLPLSILNCLCLGVVGWFPWVFPWLVGVFVLVMDFPFLFS